MERKYKNQKKTIMVLGIIAILLIAVIVYQQVRITNVKAEQDEYWNEQHELKEQELADAKAEYESKDLKDREAELKDENKHLKSYSKDIAKAFEKGEDIEAIIAEYEGTAAEEGAADEPEETEPVETEPVETEPVEEEPVEEDAAEDKAAEEEESTDEE